MSVASTSLLITSMLVASVAFPSPAALKDGLRVADPADVSLHAAPLDALTAQKIDDAFPDTTSVLIYKDGSLVFERYFGPGGLRALNDIRSVSKTFTAFVAGQAIAEGAIRSADQTAFDLLPDLAPFRHDGAVKRAITLMDLLTMSSALDCNDFDADNVGNEENMYPLTRWSRWAADLPVKPGYARTHNGRGPFSYCTAGAFLLGQVIQHAAHTPLDQYFDQRLFRPLGIREREWTRSPSGEWQTGGGLRLRSRDLLKLGVLLLDEGRWQGAQVVPRDWIRRMQAVTNVVDDKQSYGALLWQRSYATPCGPVNGWYMAGNGGNVVVSARSQSMVAVVTRTHYNRPGMHEQTSQLLEEHVFGALACTPARAAISD